MIPFWKWFIASYFKPWLFTIKHVRAWDKKWPKSPDCILTQLLMVDFPAGKNVLLALSTAAITAKSRKQDQHVILTWNVHEPLSMNPSQGLCDCLKAGRSKEAKYGGVGEQISYFGVCVLDFKELQTPALILHHFCHCSFSLYRFTVLVSHTGLFFPIIFIMRNRI